MADNTHIEWADATWQPITGCSVVSPGCTNCYAMRLAGTRLQHHPSCAGLTQDSKAGPVWTGEVRFNEEWLDQPLRWSGPRRISVCTHGDLFHEAAPDDWIDRVFAVMALAPQHTFLVLTKRAARMRDYCTPGERPRQRRSLIKAQMEVIRGYEGKRARIDLPSWPLPNVWLGVSVEDQARADERIPELLATPAVRRFISAEPLLGPVEISRYLYAGHRCLITGWPGGHPFACGDCDPCLNTFGFKRPARVEWIIAGSESGPSARPCDIPWIRSLRDQCADASVPFFWKQHVKNGRKISLPTLDGKIWAELPI